MKKMFTGGLLTLCVMLVVAGTAAAAEFKITWKNAMNATVSCNSMEVKVVSGSSVVAQKTSRTPLAYNATQEMLLTAPSCSNIILNAYCQTTKGIFPMNQTVSCVSGTASTRIDPLGITFAPAP